MGGPVARRAASRLRISLATYCAEEPIRRCAQIGRTREQLPAWHPTLPRRGRRPGNVRFTAIRRPSAEHMRHADRVLWKALQETASSNVDPWQVWAPGASAVIAAIALLVSLSNRKTAKRALYLSECQEARRAARLDLSLHEAISWRPAGRACRWIGVRVLAVNPTDRDGSLIAADLHITYTIPGGTVMVVKIPHRADAEAMPESIAPLEVPAPLPGNGAVAGWLMFKVDDALIGDAAIERYDAVLHDSRGPVEGVQPWVLREIVDGKAS